MHGNWVKSSTSTNQQAKTLPPSEEPSVPNPTEVAPKKGANFYQELRSRRIYRIAGGYIVSAWIVLQVASILVPSLGTTHLDDKGSSGVARPRLLLLRALLSCPLRTSARIKMTLTLLTAYRTKSSIILPKLLNSKSSVRLR